MGMNVQVRLGPDGKMETLMGGQPMSLPLFDPSSKWMIEEQGASILYLAGVRSVVSCRAHRAAQTDS